MIHLFTLYSDLTTGKIVTPVAKFDSVSFVCDVASSGDQVVVAFDDLESFDPTETMTTEDWMDSAA